MTAGWQGSTHWDHALPQSRDDVICLLQRRIDVHQAWLDWFEAGPKEETDAATREGVGTAASQRAYIAQYRAAIEIISRQ